MGWTRVEPPKVKNAEGFWVTRKEEDMSFEATHEFAGIQLRRGSTGDAYNTYFEDAEGNVYRLPNHKVTEIKPKPQLGEVWMYVGVGGSRTPLELVGSDDRFIDVTGDRILVKEVYQDYVKVLNADGSRA